MGFSIGISWARSSGSSRRSGLRHRLALHLFAPAPGLAWLAKPPPGPAASPPTAPSRAPGRGRWLPPAPPARSAARSNTRRAAFQPGVGGRGSCPAACRSAAGCARIAASSLALSSGSSLTHRWPHSRRQEGTQKAVTAGFHNRRNSWTSLRVAPGLPASPASYLSQDGAIGRPEASHAAPAKGWERMQLLVEKCCRSDRVLSRRQLAATSRGWPPPRPPCRRRAAPSLRPSPRTCDGEGPNLQTTSKFYQEFFGMKLARPRPSTPQRGRGSSPTEPGPAGLDPIFRLRLRRRHASSPACNPPIAGDDKSFNSRPGCRQVCPKYTGLSVPSRAAKANPLPACHRAR